MEATCVPAGRHLEIPVLTIVDLTLHDAEFARGYYVKSGRPTAQVERIPCALRELNRLYASESAAEFGRLKLQTLQSALIGRSD